MKRIGAVALFVAGAACLAQSRDSPASRVLLVYVENSPESVAVADVYAEKRGIPATNLCAISLPDRVATVLGAAEYDETVKTPVRACLETVGKQHILYIVLSYVRPYAVDPGAGLGKYALDSYLADIWDEYATQHFNPAPQRPHPYYVDNQAQGNFFHSFMSLAEFRKQDDVPLFYSVWRLDGSTPEIATGLVDNAIYAETHGLAGQACIDALADPTGSPDSSYRATDWDLYRAAQALRRAGSLFRRINSKPSSVTNLRRPPCSDAALYAGWYSVNNYYDVFTWVPGAIGFHLDSNSALDRGRVQNWSANALNRGVTVTSGAIAEPYLEGMRGLPASFEICYRAPRWATRS